MKKLFGVSTLALALLASPSWAGYKEDLAAAIAASLTEQQRLSAIEHTEISATASAAAENDNHDDNDSSRPFYEWSYEDQIAYQRPLFDTMANTSEFQKNAKDYPLAMGFKTVFLGAVDFAASQLHELKDMGKDFPLTDFLAALKHAKAKITLEFILKKFTQRHGVGLFEWLAKVIDAAYEQKPEVPFSAYIEAGDIVRQNNYGASSKLNCPNVGIGKMASINERPIFLQFLYLVGGNGIFDYDLMSEGYFRKNAPIYGVIPLSGHIYRENEGAHGNLYFSIDKLLWHDVQHHLEFSKKFISFTHSETNFILRTIAEFIEHIKQSDTSDLNKKVAIHAITHVFHENNMNIDLYAPCEKSAEIIKQHNLSNPDGEETDLLPPTLLDAKGGDPVQQSKILLAQSLMRSIERLPKPKAFFYTTVRCLEPYSWDCLSLCAPNSLDQISDANHPEFRLVVTETTTIQDVRLNKGDIITVEMDKNDDANIRIKIGGTATTFAAVIPDGEGNKYTPYINATQFYGEAIRMYHAALNNGERWVLGHYGVYPRKAHEFQDKCFNDIVRPILENLLNDIETSARATTTARSTES